MPLRRGGGTGITVVVVPATLGVPVAPHGPEDLFGDSDIDALVDVLGEVQAGAIPEDEQS